MNFSVSSIAGRGTVVMAAAISMLCTLTACGAHDAPTTPAPSVAPSAVLNTVRVNPQAAVIAAGGTQQLTLTAAALDSTVVTAFDTTIYTSNDSTRVKVSPTGLITAATGSKATTGGTPVKVIASVTVGGVTRADTCYVAVVATQGTNPTFSIYDSTAATHRLPVSGSKTIVPTVTYMVGSTPTSLVGAGVPMKIAISPTTSALLTSPTALYVLTPLGTLHITATTTVFGVPLTDTITYTLGDPSAINIFMSVSGLIYFQSSSGTVSGAFSNATTLYLQVGGTVNFQNNLFNTPYIFNVEFTASNGGVAPDSVSALIASFTGHRAQVVTFPVAGTYTWKWTGDASTILAPDKQGGTLIVR